MTNLFPNDSLQFCKSSYSDRNNCVEVARFEHGAAVRDSKKPECGHLAFAATEWQAFISDLKNGAL
ncbi:hypothetical protein HDA32_006013 [Spinactinospora alkalitolerans]|uniref:DUF397 domain-containing protein n=1 Tax=Spinactinospora alkalitolerans TaxID=687207 RepID=A0A852U7N9_9ACTN|nr:DUF397 domain-containing protein [Spinactinospora alkalitolerans]NYE50893.1 hypothetical protein [Spinactinospora alkalitolerans]